jgi:hypothetical protein
MAFVIQNTGARYLHLSVSVLFFRMVRIWLRGINRADFNALGGIVMTHALDAFIRVDDVDGLSLADSLHRAFRLTGPAADALVGNH